MNAVFDSPVGTHCLAKFLCTSRQAGDVVAGLTRRFITYLPLGLDHSNAFEARPCPIWVQILDEFGFRDDPVPPSFDPSVAFLNRLVEIVGDILKVGFLRIGDKSCTSRCKVPWLPLSANT